MPNYYNPYYQPQQMPQQMVQPQIQNGGFVSVRSEEEARNYPVAQGTSVTFKNETAPYIYTKTTGFSQLDRPMFEKFKLVKEDTEEELKVDKVDKVASEIEALWGEINALKKRNNPPKQKNDGGN
jgi:hypothetical protein